MISANYKAQSTGKIIRAYKLTDSGEFVIYYEDGHWVRFSAGEWKIIKEAVVEDKAYYLNKEIDKLKRQLEIKDSQLKTSQKECENISKLWSENESLKYDLKDLLEDDGVNNIEITIIAIRIT